MENTLKTFALYPGDATSVRNLICYDGFLYYSLLYDDKPGMGGDRPEYIYRIPVQGGETEELALAYDTFCIYKGKIYYIGVEGRMHSMTPKPYRPLSVRMFL